MLGTCTHSCKAPAVGAGAAPLPVQSGSAAQHTCLRPSAFPSCQCIAVYLLGPALQLDGAALSAYLLAGPTPLQSGSATLHTCLRPSVVEAGWRSTMRLPASNP